MELKYLNLSGNKRLEINENNQNMLPFDKDKRLMGSTNKIDLPSRQQASGFNFYDIGQDQSMKISLSQRKCLSNFTTLTNLSMLGLMDVTCLVQPPDENDQRRIRTTNSEISQTGVPGGIIKYGISDTLCRFSSETNRRESIYINREQSNNVRESTYFTNTTNIGVIPKEKYFLGIWDVVIPKFRNMDNESLFGIFDGRGTEDGTKMAEYLFRLFAGDLQAELKKIEESIMKEREKNQMKYNTQRSKESIVLDSNSIKCAIRRTFLGLNKELGEKFRTTVSNKNQSDIKKSYNDEEDNEQFGCSAVIVYMVGDRKRDSCSLYVANVGDGTCILSKEGGNAQVISRSYKMGNVIDWASSRVYDQNQKINSPFNFNSYSLENHRALQYTVNSSQGSLSNNYYTSSTSDTPKFISGLGDEMERIQNAGGWITNDGLVNGKSDLTRAFGYFDCLGSLNANPWIVKMELEFGDSSGPSVHLTPESMDKHDDDSVDTKLKLNLNHSDEFLVLVNGAVLDAIRCGADANTDSSGFSLSTLDDTAQIIVDIARSALVNEGQKRNKGNTYQYQNISRNTKLTTGWGSAANKIRNVALSHGAYGVRNSINPNHKVKSSKGMMVMVLGLSDLIETASRWMGTRRGSTETGSDSLDIKMMGKKKEVETIPPAIKPPTGKCALVFTDIKNSTALWENHAKAMKQSINLHNTRMRELLEKYCGYEVKTDGDSFMVSFSDIMSAIQWCLDVQIELIKIDWPKNILESEDGEEVWWDTKNNEIVSDYEDEDEENDLDEDTLNDDLNDDNDNDNDIDNIIENVKEEPLEARIERKRKNGIELLFRGLCVRMGIHYGEPYFEMDPTTNRMDYFGPMVNRASRICSAAQGGQIFISSDVVQEVTEIKGGDPSQIGTNDTLDEKIADSMNVKVYNMGEKKLKGLENPEILHAIYPKQYQLRHEYFSLMNRKTEVNNLTNNALTIRSKPVIANPLIESHNPELTRIDRNFVQAIGNLCLRIEFLAVNAQNICFNNQNFDERIPVYPYIIDSSSISIPLEATEEELTAALEGIVIRIENAISILNIIQNSPLNRILRTLGSYIDVNPNQILTALHEYVLAMKERDERLERIRNERRDRERRMKNRNSKGNSSL